VVIGTSLDMDMKDDVRVTVVATGLNRAAASRQPIRIVETPPVRQRPVVLRTGTGNEVVVDYAQPEQGAVHQGRSNGSAAPSRGADAIDYLDIPAFLRRQAD
jgi:cell division protein FtsZ